MGGIDIGPKIGIEGEKQFKDAIKAINSQVKTNASELKALAAQYDKEDNAVQNLSQRQKVLGQSMNTNQQKVKALTSQFDRQKAKLDELDKALEKARKENGDGSEAAIKAENAYSKQAKAVNDLETQINTAKVQITGITKELENNSIQLKEAESRAMKYGDAMKAAGDKLSNIGGGISQAGNALTLGVTTPLLAAGSASVKFATDAETSFAKVGTIADTTVLGMDKIRDGVLGVSNDTGVAVTDFNEALYQTISATGDTANAIDYTTIAAKAAKGGFTDTATAVDGLTTVMNAYGLKGKDSMQMVSDQMLMAQNYGKTTFGELASSMGQVVPIASQLNIGTDTLLATLATLTKNGIGTSQAVTGMKAALSNIIKPTSEAADAASVLGLDFSAAALQSKGFSGFMGDVKSALEEASPTYATLTDNLNKTYTEMSNLAQAGKKNTQEYKTLGKVAKKIEDEMESIAGAADSPIAGFSTLFGSVEGLNSMLVLTSETGGKDFEGAMQAMADSSGATQSAFDKMDSTPAAQMQKELNKLKNTGIETGNKLLPMITKIVQGVGKLLDKYNDLDDGAKDLILRTAGMAAAAGPVLKIAGTATTGIGKLTSGVGGLVKDIGKLSAAKKGAEAVGQLGSKAVKSVEGVGDLSKALFKLASPGGIALVAATALVGVGAAVLKIRDDAIKADIDKHFGDIRLSAEEVEDVAKRLTTTEWTMKVGAVIEAKAKLEQAETNLKTTIETLNTLDWKIGIGLELTEAEQDSYKSALEEFARNATDYAAQQGYTVSLAIDATLGKDSVAGKGLTSFTESYFASAQKTLQTLGDDLAGQVNLAFENGTFNEERMNIQKILDQMNGIVKEIQDAEYRAELSNIQIQYSTEGLGIDKQSYDRLIAKFSETNKEVWDHLQESIKVSNTSIELEYGSMIKAGISKDFAEKYRNDVKASIEQYAQESFAVKINGDLQWAFDELPTSFDEQFGKAEDEIERRVQAYSSDIEKYFQGTEVDIAQWAQRFEVSVPPLSGAAKKTVSDMLECLRPQKEILQSIADDCISAGKTVPDSVVQGLSDISQWEAMAGNVDGMYMVLAQQIANDPARLQTVENAANEGKKIPSELGKAISIYAGIPFDATTGMFTKVKQGTELSAAEVVEQLNKVGGTLDETLANSIASQYGVIYKNGKYMVDTAAQGVKDNQPKFVKASANMADAGTREMNKRTSGATLSPPSMAAPNWTPQVLRAMNEMQLVLDNNPLVAQLQVNVNKGFFSGLNVGLSVAQHAAGGIFTTPHLAVVAEEPAGEAIIPLAASRRADAVDILSQTAEIMGYEAYSYAANAGRSVGAARAQRAEAAPVKQTVYRIEEGAVRNEIHAKTIDANELYRVISRRTDQDVKRAVKGHGR